MRLAAKLIILIAIFLAHSPGASAGDPEIRTDTPSGLPVPRFVSLKFNRTVCRVGPSFEHPTLYTFTRLGLPVRVTAETRDHWRRIEDFDGARCWAHQSTLVSVNHAVAARRIDLREGPNAGAPVSAHLDRGVVARVEKARKGWRRVSVGGVSGWAPDDALWGVQ